MKTLFFKGFWEAYDKPLGWFIDQVLAGGWSGTEIYLAGRPEPLPEIARAHKEAKLPLIAQIGTSGDTPGEHLSSPRTNYLCALECDPLFVVSHTGKDFFGFDENRRILESGIELASESGTALLHETHRGRAPSSVPLCKAYLDIMPDLRLTFDVAHLFCVHESDLSNQRASVQAIVNASDHIHARVGFGEGPQVGDPYNPMYQNWTAICMDYWTRIRDRHLAAGRPQLTVTPEFGPPPFAPLVGKLMNLSATRGN